MVAFDRKIAEENTLFLDITPTRAIRDCRQTNKNVTKRKIVDKALSQSPNSSPNSSSILKRTYTEACPEIFSSPAVRLRTYARDVDNRWWNSKSKMLPLQDLTDEKSSSPPVVEKFNMNYCTDAQLWFHQQNKYGFMVMKNDNKLCHYSENVPEDTIIEGNDALISERSCGDNKSDAIDNKRRNYIQPDIWHDKLDNLDFLCSNHSLCSAMIENDDVVVTTNNDISLTSNNGDDKHPPLLALGAAIDESSTGSQILSSPLRYALRKELPYFLREDNFWLKYSLARDGASLITLFSQLWYSARTILAIETVEGDIFGAFTSSSWRNNGSRYFGSGECFLWRWRKEEPLPEEKDEGSIVEVFPWSGANRNFQLSNPRMLAVGGGERQTDENETYNSGPSRTPLQCDSDCDWGFGLALDGSLETGTTSSCVTFKSPPLLSSSTSQSSSNDDTSGGVFRVSNIEAWAMTPAGTIHEAERLEIRRAFLYANGDFVED